MLKRLLTVSLILALLIPAIPANAAYRPVKVNVNDYPVYMDVNPIIRDGRTYVPIRAIAETLGIGVSYEEAHYIPGVKLYHDYTVFEFRIGGNWYGMYGQYDPSEDLYHFHDVYVLYRDEKSFIYNGRTFIPLRLCAEALGLDVYWDNSTRSVYIYGQPGKIYPPDDAIYVGQDNGSLDDNPTMDDYYYFIYE